ncbi:hypothetical protein [Coleofasciculus chthonoplastes]
MTRKAKSPFLKKICYDSTTEKAPEDLWSCFEPVNVDEPVN